MTVLPLNAVKSRASASFSPAPPGKIGWQIPGGSCRALSLRPVLGEGELLSQHVRRPRLWRSLPWESSKSILMAGSRPSTCLQPRHQIQTPLSGLFRAFNFWTEPVRLFFQSKRLGSISSCCNSHCRLETGLIESNLKTQQEENSSVCCKMSRRNKHYKIIKNHSLESFQNGKILMISCYSPNDVKIHRHGKMALRKGTEVLTVFISGL